MVNEDTRPPFDENAALEELERLREEIRQVRSRREQKVEEFEAWVRETRTASRAERVAAVEQEASDSRTAAAARAASRAAEPVNQSSITAAAPATDEASLWMILDDDRPQRRRRGEARGRLGGRPAYYAAGAAVVLFGALILSSTLSDRNPELPAATTEGPATAPSVTTPPAASPDKATARAPAAVRRALQVELTTIRPVWMRVTVDGERRIEREVPAGQRLSFAADRAIAIRAGDGGGVRLTIDGRDVGLLGRDGQIATRTLTPR
jgi:hypothetical protein